MSNNAAPTRVRYLNRLIHRQQLSAYLRQGGPCELTSERESRNCHRAALHEGFKATEAQLWLWSMVLFRSLRHQLDPLDLEILERAFEASWGAVKESSQLMTDFDSDEGLEASLRRELIEIACLNGVSDPENLRDILLGRLPPVEPTPQAG